MSSSISFKTVLRAKNIGEQKFWQLLRLTESMFLGSTYYFAFQQFYPKNNYLLNVFSISDVNYLPFAVVLYVDGMMTAMLIGCVFSILEKMVK